MTSEITIRRAIMGFGPLEGLGELPLVAPLENVANGVWIAGGGSHNSLVVEMSDFLVVAEPPLFEERSVGVIEALKFRFPEKPVRYVIVSHFHGDHSGGVRAYAALGATVVAHESIAPFLEVVLSRPRTIHPDALSRSDQPGTIQRVGEFDEISDPTRSIQVWHVPNDHADGMLATYIPGERIMFVSDLYSPPNPVDAANDNARAFHDFVVGRNLDVETVVGGHGSSGPFSALASVMGPAAAAAAGDETPE
jgi:glyoxylase-like metal-dependent hydrolase (beta-lactamase superfamily II)